MNYSFVYLSSNEGFEKFHAENLLMLTKKPFLILVCFQRLTKTKYDLV